MNTVLNVNATCEYLGDGRWSGKQHTKVRIEKIVIFDADEEDYEDGMFRSDAYMRVYFNTSDWDTEKLGLPYTSDNFVKGIADLLRGELGEFADKIEWTEQGMQWTDYASVCVPNGDNAELFIEKFKALCEKYKGRVLIG